MLESKNKPTLEDFARYCQSHPEERFWQALANWSKGYIYFSNIAPSSDKMILANSLEDTFYREGK